jgi:hypothetical protein
MPDVEEERARGIGDIGRALAGEPQPEEILRKHDRARPGERVGLVLSQPHDLRRREPGKGAVAGQRDQAIQADELLDLTALLRRPLVVPQDRRTNDPVGPVERDEPVHLAREPNRGRPAAEGGERLRRRGNPPLRILLGPARLRDVDPVRDLCVGNGLALVRDGDGLQRGRTHVETDERTGPIAQDAASGG